MFNRGSDSCVVHLPCRGGGATMTELIAGPRREGVDKISAAVHGRVASEAGRSRPIGRDGVPRATSPEPFAPMIGAERKRCAPIIRERKIGTE